MTARTGYDLREGAEILAARRVQNEQDREVAEAILLHWKSRYITRLWREALRLLDEPVERAA